MQYTYNGDLLVLDEAVGRPHPEKSDAKAQLAVADSHRLK